MAEKFQNESSLSFLNPAKINNRLKKLLEICEKNGASDLHISSNNLPTIRIDGDLQPIPESKILSHQETLDMIESALPEDKKEIYKNRLEVDFSIQLNNDSRFRVNAFNTINGAAAVFRVIPLQIRTLDELEMPEIIKKLTQLKQGLILVTGPTGSGKSTTLAAIIDYINENYRHHIITIEDPIEFIHKTKKSLINQREVGRDTLSFSSALRISLREDPDIILIGELRDLETIQFALTAAETGHLVLATLHTNSAAKSINRIIDIFPGESKGIIRSMFSDSLAAILSQTLLKRKEGGRIAAVEILLATNAIRNLIKEGKVPQIKSTMQLNTSQGMITMDATIQNLLNLGKIDRKIAEEALAAYL
ncbi:MAG: type IV pilus twitching motility protein PilT [Candidatus Thorarchaeota archaeon]